VEVNRVRKASVRRETKETRVVVSLDLDGVGNSKIDTGVKFLDHMLDSFAAHGLFDITIKAKGDIEVDDHHTAEDAGIVLGEAFKKALGNKEGVKRFGDSIVPMDDSLAIVAVDISGRPYTRIDLPFSEFKEKKVGDLSKENIKHFLNTFANSLGMNLYARVEGENDHHKVEALFKALAKAMDEATRIDARRKKVPSAKGVLE
jgi:imidazoleglycerol-phosphate dehydratase